MKQSICFFVIFSPVFGKLVTVAFLIWPVKGRRTATELGGSSGGSDIFHLNPNSNYISWIIRSSQGAKFDKQKTEDRIQQVQVAADRWGKSQELHTDIT